MGAVGAGFEVVYRPCRPLKCGARLWVETRQPVRALDARGFLPSQNPHADLLEQVRSELATAEVLGHDPMVTYGGQRFHRGEAAALRRVLERLEALEPVLPFAEAVSG